jgi:hypothetical protein
MSRVAALDLLGLCLGGAADAARLRQAAIGVDWEAVLGLAHEAAVVPALGPALHACGAADLPPGEVMTFLDGMAELNRLRNAILRDELLAIARCLNRIGLVPLALKGAAGLLDGLYPDPAARQMTDLDLLLPAADVPRAAAALHAAGWREVQPVEFPAHHHWPAMIRPGGIVSVELHSEPLDRQFDTLLPAAAMLAAGETWLGDGAVLSIPGPTERLILAVAHAELADHARLYGRLPLRELLDVALLARRSGAASDWTEAQRRFTAAGALVALDAHRLALARILGVPTPGPPPGRRARLLHRYALWVVGHPRLARAVRRGLRPALLLRRSLATAVQRRRLLRNLFNPAWCRRQWAMLRTRS